MQYTCAVRTWIVLADSGRARLYEVKGVRRDWTRVRELDHPESRLHESELLSDKPGRVKQSSGRRAALEWRTPRHKVEAEKFAREVSKVLTAMVDALPPERIVLVTPPPFLGLLRDKLVARVEALIVSVVEKDYLHLEPPELKERLQAQI